MDAKYVMDTVLFLVKQVDFQSAGSIQAGVMAKVQEMGHSSELSTEHAGHGWSSRQGVRLLFSSASS